MGWASAGSIFDPIAQALIDLNATDDMKRAILGPLISRLQDNDWDTEDESADQFKDDPVIAELFAKAGVGCHLWNNTTTATGELAYTGSGWMLHCDEHTRLQWTDEDTAAGHDQLVHAWATHLQESHDGDGAVDTALLFDRKGGTN